MTKILKETIIQKCVAITDRIFLLANKQNITTKDLSNKTGLKISFIDNLFTNKNITLKILAKIELALGEKIIITPNEYEAYLVKNIDKLINIIDYVKDNPEFINKIQKLMNNFEFVVTEELKINQRTHTKKRALERYQIILTDLIYDNLCSKIIRGNSIIIDARGHYEKHIIAYGDELIPICYCRPTKQIATFYPVGKLTQFNKFLSELRKTAQKQYLKQKRKSINRDRDKKF